MRSSNAIYGIVEVDGLIADRAGESGAKFIGTMAAAAVGGRECSLLICRRNNERSGYGGDQ